MGPGRLGIVCRSFRGETTKTMKNGYPLRGLMAVITHNQVSLERVSFAPSATQLLLDRRFQLLP